MPPPPLMVAQATPPADLLDFLQYGVLGLVVLLFILGKIIPGVVHSRALKENDELKAEMRQLQAVFLEKVIPALTRATDLMARMAERQRSE